MKNHLSHSELIDFQFKLCSKRKQTEITEHLKSCDTCRRLALSILNTLTQLDVIKPNPKTSETLITDTLRTIRLSGKPKPTHHVSWFWLGGVVATAAGLALIITFAPMTRQQPIQFASHSDAVDELVWETVSSTDSERPQTKSSIEEKSSISSMKQFASALSQPVPPPRESLSFAGARQADSSMSHTHLADKDALSELPSLSPPKGNTQITILAMADTSPQRHLTNKKAPHTSLRRLLGNPRAESPSLINSIAPTHSLGEQPQSQTTAPRQAYTQSIIGNETTVYHLGPEDSVRIQQKPLPIEETEGQPTWPWQVSVLNTSTIPVRLLLTRENLGHQWIIRVLEEATPIAHTNQNAQISIDIPAQSERSFIYRIFSSPTVE